jgi:STAM-binding protein
MAGSINELSQPMSVKEITTKADDFYFDTAVPLKFWLRTADTLFREVNHVATQVTLH